jgi:5'-3' exonuclease
MDIEVEGAMKPSCLPIWEDYLAVKMCLGAAGYQMFQAKYEAEALCSYLYATNKVVAVITEDSDVLAYLCGACILHCNAKEETVNVHVAMEDMDLVPSQFIDLCVLLGNDFNPRIKNIGPKKSLALLKKYGTLDHILEWGRIWNPSIRDLSDDDIRSMKYTRRIFQSFCGEECSIE